MVWSLEPESLSGKYMDPIRIVGHIKDGKTDSCAYTCVYVDI